MKALHSRGHRPLRLAISKYEPGPVAGPGLSAVRAACKPHEANLAGLELVFDAIGGHLDESLAHRAIDEGFRANGRGVRVAISDVRWRGRVLTTEFGVEEIAPLMRKADDSSIIVKSIEAVLFKGPNCQMLFAPVGSSGVGTRTRAFAVAFLRGMIWPTCRLARFSYQLLLFAVTWLGSLAAGTCPR